MTRDQIVQRLRYRTEEQRADDAAGGAFCLERVVEIADAAVQAERERCAGIVTRAVRQCVLDNGACGESDRLIRLRDAIRSGS